MLLAPLTWITGSSSIELLPLTTVLQVGVLGPIATLAVYDIGARLAGRLAGLWCAAVFVAAPFLAIPFFVDRYHDSWVDQILPQALGLTQQADFPSVVAVLVAAALTVRALEAGAQREAVLAGTFAGVALALKPANALFLVAPAAAFVLARRWRHAVLFGIALVPALVALTIWKSKGLGTVPLFAQSSTTLAAGLGDPVLAESWFERTFDIDFETWKQNMSNLREFSWSARIVQFLPLAGARRGRTTFGSGRRAAPRRWLLAYVVVKGSASVATIESGSYWRLVMPALPAFALLAAAMPLLVPTFLRRHGRPPRAAPGRAAGTRATVAAVVVLSLIPIVVLLVASPSRAQPSTTRRSASSHRRSSWTPTRPGRRGRRPPRGPPHGERERARLDRLDAPRGHLLSRVPGQPLGRVPRHGLRAARRRPLRAALGDARHDPRAPLPRSESRRGRRYRVGAAPTGWTRPTAATCSRSVRRSLRPP